MLFGALVIYIILWLPLHIIIQTANNGFIADLSMIIGLYIFSFIIFYLVVFLVYSYQPEAKPFVRKLIKLLGVRWIALLTVVINGLIIYILFKSNELSYFSIGLLAPVLLVSLMNSFSIDVFPNMLKEDDKVPKVILPNTISPDFKPTELKSEIQKTFDWVFQNNQYTLNLVIRNSIYKYFKNQERVLDYQKWADEYVKRGICGEVRELAYKLLQLNQSYKTFNEVSYILSFVQQIISYKNDVGEYPKYPVESLVDQEGDCEDFAILGAAILKVIGYKVALLSLPHHVALGVAGAKDLPGMYVEYKGVNYYYCEMTDDGWKIGEIPKDYKRENIRVMPIPSLIIT